MHRPLDEQLTDTHSGIHSYPLLSPPPAYPSPSQPTHPPTHPPTPPSSLTFLVSGQEQQIFFPLFPSLGGSASTTGLLPLLPIPA